MTTVEVDKEGLDVVFEGDVVMESKDCRTEPMNVISIQMEQCSICSGHYELPRNTFPQPDLNRLICKVLDISPVSITDGQTYFSTYIPLCPECTKKLRKYDKIRMELDILRQQVVASTVDTLVHIRPTEKTPLHFIKNQIVTRWAGRNSKTQPIMHSTPHILSHSARKSNIENKPVVTSNVDMEESWVTEEVSIVADSESEVQEILAAYMAGNLIQGQVREVSSSQNETTFEVTESVPDTATHVTLLASEPVAEENELISPSKKKHKRRNVYHRVPQHEKPPFFCEKCGRVYSKFSTLRIHAKTCDVIPSGDEIICCPVCAENFPGWVELKLHFDDIHPNTVLEKCKFCRKDFLPFTMDGHQCRRVLMGENPILKSYPCDYCDKMYYKYTSLSEHVRRTHPLKDKFPCSICHKQFVSKLAMEDHEKGHPVVTNGRRTHRCSVCGIVCTTAWGLREHLKLHTGARPYACEICGKTFRLLNIKRNHMVVHTKEKNFTCEICGKTFTLYATMYRHWKKCRLPSVPKRGRWCPICVTEGILFQKSSSLKEHMLRKHPGTKEQFQICSEPGNREFGFEGAEKVAVSKEKRRRFSRTEKCSASETNAVETPIQGEEKAAAGNTDILRRSLRKRVQISRSTETTQTNEDDKGSPRKEKLDL